MVVKMTAQGTQVEISTAEQEVQVQLEQPMANSSAKMSQRQPSRKQAGKTDKTGSNVDVSEFQQIQRERDDIMDRLNRKQQ